MSEMPQENIQNQPEYETAEDTPPQPPPAPQDSAAFTRCALCRHADAVNTSAGTLICVKHNMQINAEADEIPDDCPEQEPRSDS